MSNDIEIINNYLEDAYSGAQMMNDMETALKIGRAIAALNASVDMDIFTEEFEEFHVTRGEYL